VVRAFATARSLTARGASIRKRDIATMEIGASADMEVASAG